MELQAEKVFNQAVFFKKTVKAVGEPMAHLESIASSAVSSFCSTCSFILLCGDVVHSFRIFLKGEGL